MSWTPEDFQRRHYSVQSPELDTARRIELRVIVDGKTLVQVQAREPGIVAFVSRPADQGFEIELVEAAKVRFTDIRTPAGAFTEALAPWQIEALDLAK